MSTTSPISRQLFAFFDLAKVSCCGDKNLHKYMVVWDGVISGLKNKILDQEEEIIFLKQIRNVFILEFGVAYDRAAAEDPQRSYNFLRTSVMKCLTRARQVKQQN